MTKMMKIVGLLALVFAFAACGRGGQAQEPTPLSAADIFEKSADAVFSIYTSFDNVTFQARGGGFFVCESGIALTNHHVVEDWPYAKVRTHEGQEFPISGYLFYDTVNDFAILQVEGDSFAYLPIGEPDTLRVGDCVFLISSPNGHNNSFSGGMVSRFTDVENDEAIMFGMIQFTAAMSYGSSGGALINNRGQAVGIAARSYPNCDAQMLNFAVPMSIVSRDLAHEHNLSILPIGDAEREILPALVGAWDWYPDMSYFSADGSGLRVWNGVEATFHWFTVNSWLVFDIDDGSTEAWELEIVDEFLINIGGAPFWRRTSEYVLNIERVDVYGNPLPNDFVFDPSQMTGIGSSVVGEWLWDFGIYIFREDGTGWRDWGDIELDFWWYVEHGIIHLLFDDENNDEAWQIFVLSEDELSIGGALFTRV